MIYLAQPYTHQDTVVMQTRYEIAVDAVAYCLKTIPEHVPYSPIVAFHEAAVKYGLPKDFNYWMCHNFRMLKYAGIFMIIKADGWEESRGVAVEHAYAVAHGIPVRYLSVAAINRCHAI